MPVSITMIPNTSRDGNRTYNLDITDNDPNMVPSIGLLQVTALDFDLPTITKDETLTVEEGGSSVALSVELVGVPTGGTVTVDMTVDPAYLLLDGAATASLTFSEAGVPQTVQVSAPDNTTIEQALVPYQEFTKMISFNVSATSDTG